MDVGGKLGSVDCMGVDIGAGMEGLWEYLVRREAGVGRV